jgi:enterobactin synthetase component D / holo-[acyl-carrier protein] synthase
LHRDSLEEPLWSRASLSAGGPRSVSPMLSSLLPACAVSKEARNDLREHQLFAEEKRIIASSVIKRRTEFSTSRGCAHSAIAELGLRPTPVLSGPRGEPVWPRGIVGSITHCQGYRAAAVGRQRDLLSIGIDAEPHLPLPPGLVFDVTLPEERSALNTLSRLRSDVHWDRVHFSAKESVYKTWFPLTGIGLDFHQCRLSFDPWQATFNLEIRAFAPRAAVRALSDKTGRWKVADGLILTALAIETER